MNQNASERRLLEDIFATREDEIQCNDAHIQMARSTHAQMSDEESRQAYPAMWHHFRFCEDCREEYVMLAELTRLEAEGKLERPTKIPPRPLGKASQREHTPGLGRRIIEAIFQQPLRLPQPVRGSTLNYRTENLNIHLVIRQIPGEQGLYQIRGQVRTPEGQPALDLVSKVVVRSTTETAERLQEIEQEGGFEFVIKGLPAGQYTMSLITAGEEIVIRQLAVGDDE